MATLGPYVFSFARGLNSPIANGEVDFPDITPGGQRAWVAQPLPELVLEPLSRVVLKRISFGGENLVVDNIAIAYTPMSSGDASTVLADYVPLLTPLPLDEQAG